MPTTYLRVNSASTAVTVPPQSASPWCAAVNKAPHWIRAGVVVLGTPGFSPCIYFAQITRVIAVKVRLVRVGDQRAVVTPVLEPVSIVVCVCAVG